MNVMKRLIYIFLGGFLALGLALGAYAASAQTDDATEEAAPESESDTTPDVVPERPFDRDGRRGDPRMSGDDQYLADALGITVEDLAAAKVTAMNAAIEQAVTEGLLTQEQADALQNGTGRSRFDLGRWNAEGTIDSNALLADALGISVEELDAARDAAFSARLAAQVEAGNLTQEQADQIQANKDVQAYIDRDALNATIQSFFESAINEAVVDGVITADQAQVMLDNLATMGTRGFGGPSFGGGRGHGHGGHGGHDGPRGGGNFFGPEAPAEAAPASGSGA
jgi:hypothetical protein